MGLDYRTIRALANLKIRGDYLCLGRPHWMGSNKDTVRLARECDFVLVPEMLAGRYRDRFADPLLKAIGAERLYHADIDDHEGVNFLWDLNQPVSTDQRFDLVLDNGTLEHVFCFHQAILNCMTLVRRGGAVVVTLPANNQCGHGFIQISPEYFYRAFSRANGFESQVVLMDYGPFQRDVPVPDPALAGHRHVFISPFQQVLFGVARKVDDTTRFFADGWPQQSDYVEYWRRIRAEDPAQLGRLRPTASRIEVAIIHHFPRLARFLQAFKFSAFNPTKWL